MRPPSSGRVHKAGVVDSPFMQPRPSSEAQPLPRTTSIGDDDRGTSPGRNFDDALFSLQSAGYSIAFSEVSRSDFDSPRADVVTSQRATRDLSNVNHASISGAAVASVGPGSLDYAGSGGSIRSSTDYKMLIAKADAMLGQIAVQRAGSLS